MPLPQCFKSVHIHALLDGQRNSMNVMELEMVK